MDASTIPLEDVATMPAPGMNFPVNVSFAPDGHRVAFLHSRENQLTRELYALDLRTREISLLASPPNQGNTEGNLSLEEKLRRERQRQMGVGITSYAWCPVLHAPGLLCPLQGDLYLQPQAGAELQLLFDKASTGAAGGAIDPQFSPDGRWVAFVQDKEVYVLRCDLSGDRMALQITTGARGVDGKSNGLACFLTQEELSRFRGFWWSPDGSHIAFEQVDDAHIPTFRIMHYGNDDGDAGAHEDHRYPFAGGPNPVRRLGVVPVRRSLHDPIGTPVWLDFEQDDPDFYISRVNWLPDQSLGVQCLNRLQDEVTFYRFDTTTGKRSVLLHETNPVWVNASYLYRSIEAENKAAFRFIWGSERTGHMHLYLYEYKPETQTAQLLGALTSGEWSVESIEGVDLAQGKLYFCGTKDTPLERHLYVTSLFPGESVATPTRLTSIPAMHTIIMDGSCRHFVDVYSNIDTPPTARVCSLPSQIQLGINTIEEIYEQIEANAIVLHADIEQRVTTLRAANKLPAPKLMTVATRDTQEILHGAIYLPDADKFGPGPYPTLVSVYGGPHVQRVANMWSMTVDMRAQRFRDLGYLVFKVDNRGSFRRGSAFEGAIKHRMGTIEIADQQDGVNALIEQGLTIPDRVGIYGWSYGGYMSALSLMKAPETFKLAVAGAPVTNWDGYDTCYTERYMSTPQLNPQGYREGSVMEAVGNMQDTQKLLLVHGLIDENVHFRHTARLINALIRARKHYDLLLFPNERHSPRGLEDRIYMEKRIFEYVLEHL